MDEIQNASKDAIFIQTRHGIDIRTQLGLYCGRFGVR